MMRPLGVAKFWIVSKEYSPTIFLLVELLWFDTQGTLIVSLNNRKISSIIFVASDRAWNDKPILCWGIIDYRHGNWSTDGSSSTLVSFLSSAAYMVQYLKIFLVLMKKISWLLLLKSQFFSSTSL